MKNANKEIYDSAEVAKSSLQELADALLHFELPLVEVAKIEAMIKELEDWQEKYSR